MSLVLINTESSISVLQNVLTSERTIFFYLYFHQKSNTNQNSMKQTLYFTSLLFFHCSKSSQQKVLWNIGVLTFFFAEILEKHKRIIFFFHIAVSWRATLLLQSLLKSQ